MSQKEDEVDFGTENDPTGQIDKKTIQSRGRVAIDDSWLKYHGFEEGDTVMLICREDEIAIKKNDVSALGVLYAMYGVPGVPIE